MKISKQAQRTARQLFRSCQVDGLLDEGRVRQMFALLLAQKPHRYLEILSRLHRLVKLDLERHTAQVESATPLPVEVQTRMIGRIKKKYGPGIEVVFNQNPRLLGGVRLKVGSDLYDGSIRTRLEQLEQSF